MANITRNKQRDEEEDTVEKKTTTKNRTFRSPLAMSKRDECIIRQKKDGKTQRVSHKITGLKRGRHYCKLCPVSQSTLGSCSEEFLN